MPFLFLSENKIDTLGSLTLYEDEPLSANTDYDLSAIIDRKRKNQFEWSAGTGTNTSLHATLNSEVITTICLQNINFEDFEIHVNSATVTPIGADTTDSHWDDWSNANFYLRIASTTANTVEVIVYTTTSGDDRACGQFIIAEEIYELPRNPSYIGYKPILTGNRLTKYAADGGGINYNLIGKFRADLSFDYIGSTMESDFYSLYDTNDSYNFIPFPTTSTWDGDIWEINFAGDYPFKQPAVNDRGTPYYKGSIKIVETPL